MATFRYGVSGALYVNTIRKTLYMCGCSMDLGPAAMRTKYNNLQLAGFRILVRWQQPVIHSFKQLGHEGLLNTWAVILTLIGSGRQAARSQYLRFSILFHTTGSIHYERDITS